MTDFKMLYNDAKQARSVADKAWERVRFLQSEEKRIKRELEEAEDEATWRSKDAIELEQKLEVEAAS